MEPNAVGEGDLQNNNKKSDFFRKYKLYKTKGLPKKERFY